LRGARDLKPSKLSDGMARRVALTRAIVHDPMLAMYDEPLTTNRSPAWTRFRSM
jgi:phospholipid/cholesterol/gamma-HCH transport system ATP-binding protein